MFESFFVLFENMLIYSFLTLSNDIQIFHVLYNAIDKVMLSGNIAIGHMV